MTKITKEKFKEIIDKNKEETKIEFSNLLQNIYDEKLTVPLDEFATRTLPRLLSATLVISEEHSESLLLDVLNELDLIEK
ncbi:hypothetical protein [Oceanobacillus salinisoli]|uniref:hypothetical protein n=1 Tax=Oceanobacillus salinisoli TaxID=2678611 RepID=UPI0012E18AC3|nr:hypothetical protein [Oceanobacillus salinisoli]